MDFENSLTYFHDLFDKVLDEDDEAILLLTNIVLKHGLSAINDIADKVTYPRKKEIINRSCKICLDVLKEIQAEMDMIKPFSIAYGYKWRDQTYIVLKENSLEKEKIYINGKESDKHQKINKKWSKMQIEDIGSTLNKSVTIDDTTVTCPPVTLILNDKSKTIQTLKWISLIAIVLGWKLIRKQKN